MTTATRPTAHQIDWIAAKAQMAAAIEQTEALLEYAVQDADERAGQRSPRRDFPVGQRDEEEVGVVTFTLSHRQFALEIAYVCEIVSKARISPLPSMPPHVCGVCDLRGQLLPVFDLSGLLDVTPRNGSPNEWAIVCGQAHPEFLILSEVVPEILTFSLEDFRATEPCPEDKSWHCATTKTGTIVLDGRRLLDDRQFFLEDRRIIVDDEAERTDIDEPPTGK